MTVFYSPIVPETHGGGGYGNTYRFRVTDNGVTTLSTCERDVAWHFERAKLAIPAEISGPYDGFGRRISPD